MKKTKMKTKTKINILGSIIIILLIASFILSMFDADNLIIMGIEYILGSIVIVAIVFLYKFNEQYKKEKIDEAKSEEDKQKIKSDFEKMKKRNIKIVIIAFIIGLVLCIGLIIFFTIYLNR